MDRQAVIDELSSFTALDPDEINKIVDAIIEEDYAPPTGEGMSTKEARRTVIAEANKIIKSRNQRRLARSQAETELVREGKRNKAPFPLILLNPLYSRHLNEAVCMLRTQTKYNSLLNAAGF